jgi:hypothetical protein
MTAFATTDTIAARPEHPEIPEGTDALRFRRGRVLRHALGIGWVIAAGVCTLLPALHHGLSLGPYDILTRGGLTSVSGTTVHNTVSGDQIAEMIPWTSLAWTQVHHGHLPLWSSYNGMGLPLAFNWQSGAFSLPALIGYLVPLHLAYTAQILVTLVLAGTGAYFLASVLGAGVIGSAMAGTVFELSGDVMAWLGWPHAAVISLAGWLFAFAILIVRGRHRARDTVLFAAITAWAIYAGEPEIFTILALSLAVFALCMVVVERHGSGRSWRRSLRPLLDMSLGGVAGIALAAPLVLPGLQLLGASTRSNGTLLSSTEVGRSLPPHDLVHLLVQGYNGLPLAGSQVFDDSIYMDTAAYVGVIALALAVLAAVRHWRRPAVAAFLALTGISLAVLFVPPVEAVFIHLPLVQTIDWHRGLMMLGLCIAVLAGLGTDTLVKETSSRSALKWVGGVLAVGMVLLLLLWLFVGAGIGQLETRLRRDSLQLPLLTAGLALVTVVVCLLWRARRREGRPNGSGGPLLGRVAALVLLALETVFLVASGAQLWSSTPGGVVPTPAVRSLARTVGNARVGFGEFTCFLGPGISGLGVLPESNILFGVHEFDIYDPILPRAYVRSWAQVSRTPAGAPIYNSFCPRVTTAAEARRYGIQFVLEPSGAAGPAGAVFVSRIGDELLYRIPGSSDGVLVPMSRAGSPPPADAIGRSVDVSQTAPSSFRVTTSAPHRTELRLRITDVPGWHATIDGRPLAVMSFAGVMLQAVIPPGHHVVELHYWPTLFTVGIVVALLAVLVLAAVLVIAAFRRD